MNKKKKKKKSQLSSRLVRKAKAKAKASDYKARLTGTKPDHGQLAFRVMQHLFT